MDKYLWKLKEKDLQKTNLFQYSNFLQKEYKINLNENFNKIWKWSVENPEIFWKSIWNFTKVKGVLGNVLLQKSEIFFKNKFFPNSHLNYAENLLIKKNEDPAIIFRSENKYKTVLSWKDLNLNIAEVSNWMKLNGVKKGDCAAAYLPNIPETVVAYLSTAAIGAIWSSCSPDFGTKGVIDRFSQINPKIYLLVINIFIMVKK